MAVIAAGDFKRKKLIVPKGEVRPSQRHLRLSIFDFLAEFIKKARILDLFAGTGAFGIEALSHGAAYVTFVDIASKSVETIKQNLVNLGLKHRGTVYQSDALQFVMRTIRKGEVFDIIFIDPPFTKLRAMPKEQYESYMLELVDRIKAVMNEYGLVIVKYPKKLTLPIPTGLVLMEEKRYGLNSVAFLGQKEYIIEQEDTAQHDTGD